jgi:hypothetical protein
MFEAQRLDILSETLKIRFIQNFNIKNFVRNSKIKFFLRNSKLKISKIKKVWPKWRFVKSDPSRRRPGAHVGVVGFASVDDDVSVADACDKFRSRFLMIQGCQICLGATYQN